MLIKRNNKQEANKLNYRYRISSLSCLGITEITENLANFSSPFDAHNMLKSFQLQEGDPRPAAHLRPLALPQCLLLYFIL